MWTVRLPSCPVNGSVLGSGRDASRAPRPWQLKPWPNDPVARLLVFVDHLTIPTPADLAAADAAARAEGATTIRTSALFPRAAEVAAEAGYEVIDTLALLRLVLDDGFDRAVESRIGPIAPRTAPLRSWQHRRAAAVDQDAFGMLWGNDAASLRAIRYATPVHRARRTGRGRSLAGFAISGAAGESGYVQRLAVATANRRRGVGRDLVLDSLLWMRRRGLTTAYVNTGVTNAPALALYADLGFARMGDDLVIAERRLDAR